MASNFLLQPYNAADTAVAGASLNALASGSYALGGNIDNSTGLFPLGDLEIVLSSAVTTGTINPFLSVYLLPTMDGTDYPNPPGTAAGAAPGSLLVGTYTAVSGVATSVIQVLRMPLTQKFRLQIYNSLGVALPSTSTGTCRLYRYGFQGT